MQLYAFDMCRSGLNEESGKLGLDSMPPLGGNNFHEKSYSSWLATLIDSVNAR